MAVPITKFPDNKHHNGGGEGEDGEDADENAKKVNLTHGGGKGSKTLRSITC